MSDFGAYIIIAIVFGLFWLVAQEATKSGARAREIVHETLYHLPSFLNEKTGLGPWCEMSDFYREMHLDVKCTRCEKNTIFVSNANPMHETECIDVHYAKGKLRIMCAQQVLFDGDPLNLMSYPRIAYKLKMDQPPPTESDAYSAWAEYFNKMRSTEELPKPEQQNKPTPVWGTFLPKDGEHPMTLPPEQEMTPEETEEFKASWRKRFGREPQEHDLRNQVSLRPMRDRDKW